MTDKARLVVGLSGSSAPHYGITLLEVCKRLDLFETHLILSEGARETVKLEAGLEPGDVEALADVSYSPHDLSAPVSSGSFMTAGMVIAPCSMKSLAAIATGFAGDLLSRAADVTLKERRRLVLVPRETPLNLIHLRNMVTATEAGAVILPPVPAFYHHPKSISDLLLHTVGKILDQFRIEHDLYARWTGSGGDGA